MRALWHIGRVNLLASRLGLVVVLLFLVPGAGCRRSGAGSSAPGASGPVSRPAGPLTLDEARKYVLALVNHDRAEQGLDPVELDDVANKAGQRHAEDMAERGYTAHWGSDGSVPEQRYTEAGGTDMVQENAACFFDGQKRQLDPSPMFDAVALEKIESAFINETPPNDGHRKNILKGTHNKLGVGLAKPVGIDQPCMSQEFVDHYGDYDGLPRRARVGQTIRVAGTLDKPVDFGGIGIARIEPMKAMSAAKLNSTSLYTVPEPFALYFPAGYKTPKPVQVSGRSFKIQVPLDDHRRPGRYEVSVWGRYPGDDALVIVSLRTITVQ